MELTDNDYLSILDIELSKNQQQSDKLLQIMVCAKTLAILKTSPNLMILNDKGEIKYLYRGQYPVVYKKELDTDAKNDFYFEEVDDEK
ncbi:hypothetical protein IKE96_03850 [bacterium]|nr:hypothetical protein [bacterium]MBR2858294.1 hypothetical protein [bacterium]MBR2891047.1 hypothetical protein [Bacilli bacterium]MBR4003292.1 hypothetical protein [Clostridia bacterium]